MSEFINYTTHSRDAAQVLYHGEITLILMSLSDSFFCFSASFRLRLSSSRRFLFSSSLCRFFSSSLLLLSSLFSSLILCQSDAAHYERLMKDIFRVWGLFPLHWSIFMFATMVKTVELRHKSYDKQLCLSHLFLNFLVFDVLQEWRCPFGWNRKKGREISMYWENETFSLALYFGCLHRKRNHLLPRHCTYELSGLCLDLSQQSLWVGHRLLLITGVVLQEPLIFWIWEFQGKDVFVMRSIYSSRFLYILNIVSRVYKDRF